MGGGSTLSRFPAVGVAELVGSGFAEGDAEGRSCAVVPLAKASCKVERRTKAGQARFILKRPIPGFPRGAWSSGRGEDCGHPEYQPGH